MHQVQEDLTLEILRHTEDKREQVLTRVVDGNLLIYLSGEARPFVGRFFYEMITNWFLAGRRLRMSLFFLTELEGKCLAKVILQEGGVCDHLDLFRHEVCLGLRSSYHATKILEMKGLSSREKTVLIQERLTDYLYRFPNQFDYDLLTLMQKIFSSVPESFIAPRSPSSLARILIAMYGQNQKIDRWIEDRGHEREVLLKCFEVIIELPFGRKKALALVVSLNYVREYEVCGAHHLEAAVKTLCPFAEVVEGSGVEYREGGVQSIYMEVVGISDQKNLIKKELPFLLIQRIERLQKPLFAPRNEEEVLRNLIVLSKQLKYVKDYPQVMISFDQQVDRDLVFIVLISRIINKKTNPISSIIPKSNFILDRFKSMGMVRKKYPKEGAILRSSVPITPFLRADRSVDLVKARSFILEQLEALFGEVRDFNGGMIAKSNEAYSAVLDILGEYASRHTLLIENIFHSTTPAFMRAVVPPEVFKALFLMLLKPPQGEMTHCIQEGYLYVLVYDASYWPLVHETVKQLNLGSAELLTLNLPQVLGFVSTLCDRQLLKAIQSIIIKK
ncbi:MAG: hypothetical protein KBC64_02490 [Simkaniaceae bacterium]|nr:hypothetical protein [Simkaniaceae bacterium]